MLHAVCREVPLLKHEQKTMNAGEGVEKREPSYTVGGNVNWYSHYGEQYGGSLKKLMQSYYRILQSHFWAYSQRKLKFEKIHASQCSCMHACQVASVVSDSVRPYGQQPTRLLCPWDSLGKNTGVGCHFLLQCMKVKSQSEVAQSCPTPSDPMDCSPPGSSVHGIPGKSTGVGCLAFSIC